MAKCSTCGTTILFGGKTEAGHRYCNATCYGQGSLLRNALEQIPEDVLKKEVIQVHQGSCPRCNGPGPIDLHTSHTIWSALVLTSWRSNSEICCRACGTKSKFLALMSSGVLGWWGIPWGIIITPIQLVRNVVGLASSPDPTEPSVALSDVIRTNLAAHIIALSQQPSPIPPRVSQPQ